MFINNRHTINTLNHQAGITLVELMIVIVIVTILATVALTQYDGQQDKGFRGEGVNTLMQAVQEVEACARDRAGIYTGCTVVKFAVSDNNRFNVSVVTTATSYIVTAIRATGIDKICTTISVNNLGQKSFTSSNGDGTMQRCWSGS